MSGHSKWSQIKHKKGATDKKRAALFSKLLKTIAVVAREEPNPALNHRLRAVIEKAKANNVPGENIERALKRSSDTDALEVITVEAYGPEKSAIIIECITDNRNRTIGEIKLILKDFDARMGEQGSALWAFTPPNKEQPQWTPKFMQELTAEASEKLGLLLSALDDSPDIERITTNTSAALPE